MEKAKKSNHYRVFEVIDTFNIKKNRNCAILKDWINISQPGSLTPFESELIQQVRTQLELKWDEWNEEELKMNFIS